jgi:1,4-alpha-glucan branching enzyme
MNNPTPSPAKKMFAFLLHAHLPFVCTAEGEPQPEERWLFDALTDTYVPVIAMLNRLRQDGIPSRMTMAISPALLAMLEDPLLPNKYGQYLNHLEATGKNDPAKAKPSLARQFFFNECGGRLIKRLRDLQEDGVLEIATCAATHSMPPLLKRREAMQAQAAVAVADYRRLFERRPRGIQLPNCACAALIDETLQELQLHYVLVDDAPAGAEADVPMRTPHGLAVYARNEALSQRLLSDGADAFADQLETRNSPISTAAYDAGQFRQPWPEGAERLENVFRRLHRDRLMDCVTYGKLECLHPEPASMVESAEHFWADNSHLGLRLQPGNDWIFRHLHYAEDRLLGAIRSLRARGGASGQARLLNQAARQLMLAQSGDWPLLLAGQQDNRYAGERIVEHLSNVQQLLDMLPDAAGRLDWLGELERRWPCFPGLHYSVFLRNPDNPAAATAAITGPLAKPDPMCNRDMSAETQKHHVLMLAWEYPPNVIGGLARAVCDLSRHLAALGHTVHVVTRHLDGLEEEQIEGGVHIHRVKLLQSWNSGTAFADWVFQMNLAFADYASTLIEARYRIDVIHAHDWLVGTAAEALKRATGLPLVTTIHATEFGRSLGKLENELQRHIFRLEQRLTGISDRLIACSRSMVDEISRLFALPAERIDMIPNGVDVPAATAAASALGAATPDASAESGGPILFTIGRLVHEKGIHVLLAAMPAVLARFPQARLIIAGTGPMQGELETLARPLGAAVQFAGFVDGAAKWQLYRQAAVSVFPSLYEPFGIVALEAMAAGSPVVASRTGGLAETIRHGSNGLLVRPDSADALAKAICRLLAEPALAARLAQRASLKINKQYGWTAIAASTAEVYTGCASKSIHRAAPSLAKDVISCPDHSSSATANF